MIEQTTKHKIDWISTVKTWLFKRTNNIGKFQITVNERKKKSLPVFWIFTLIRGVLIDILFLFYVGFCLSDSRWEVLLWFVLILILLLNSNFIALWLYNFCLHYILGKCIKINLWQNMQSIFTNILLVVKKL